MTTRFTESVVEKAALGWLAELGNATAERATFGDTLLPRLMSGEVRVRPELARGVV